MEFTDIPGLDVRPGLLTVWRPAPREGRSAHWIPDVRPPSYSQEGHLTHRRTADGLSPSWIGTAFELAGTLDTEALETALTAWIDRHESLRSHLVPHKSRLLRSTLAPGTVPLRRTAVGTFPSGDALSRHIEALFDREANPAAWPSYLFAGVTRPGSTTLYMGFDHSNVDGYSLALAAYEIRELYQAAQCGGRPELDEVGSYLDFAACERRAAVLVGKDHETVIRWRDFVTSAGGNLPAFPAPVGGAEASSFPQINGLEWLLDAAQAAALEARCRQIGGSFIAGLLACLALAADTKTEPSTQRREFSTLMPFHTRNQARWERSVGWYVGLAPVRFTVQADDGFDALTLRATAALKEARPMAQVPFDRVTELLGVALEPRFFVSYMDLRHVPGAQQWAEWKAAMLRSRRIHPHEVYLWVNRSHEGTYVSFRYPNTEPGRETIPHYVSNFRQIMLSTVADREAAA
ncbi:condensation domain-containing protein [Streptomyces sp. NPDC056149]|uniref:condensation domain-containing protein n=1 Tax=Streptomyces sp. NPDC056149 TaxID=3345728 RepID=UPI0035DB357D